MAGLSPTQRTLAAMRQQGRICGIVERFNMFVGSHGVRQDLFGFIDIIAIDPADGIIGIQSCGVSFKQHIDKMMDERNENVTEWLRHAKVELWGWRKIKPKRGSQVLRWAPRIADFTLSDEGHLVWAERK